MKPKTTKIIYWIVTILFAAFMAMGAIPTQQGKDVMTHLGYPAYLSTILGVAKILGAITILQTKYKTIKEWAYSGFTIDILGATGSLYFVEGITSALATLPFFIVMFASYYFWKKKYKATV